jgi:hypothetical protein
MAKIAFSKLNLKPKYDEAVPVQIGDTTISVKKYVSIQEKLRIIGDIVAKAYNPDLNGDNPLLLDALFALEMIDAYSDIVFTDKQKEDFFKTYDALASNGIVDIIMDTIPEEEVDTVYDAIIRTNENFYSYKHSVMGVLNAILTDYDTTNLKAEDIQKLLDSDKLAFLKEVMDKMG